ncbi:MAG: D-aminoacyl-tRNA deacylase [Clostridia bacterium]|nr:D-aminoacyl-tRNA deacylase [Clostridia bacterium]
MRAVLQRVSFARVTVDKETVGAIESGLLILLGVSKRDDLGCAGLLARKTAALRIFEDDEGRLNRSLLDTGGGALVVSNFTLYADCRRGRRPDFTQAAAFSDADALYEAFCGFLAREGIVRVEKGRFGAQMRVELCNDGPVTVILDTDELN